MRAAQEMTGCSLISVDVRKAAGGEGSETMIDVEMPDLLPARATLQYSGHCQHHINAFRVPLSRGSVDRSYFARPS